MSSRARATTLSRDNAGPSPDCSSRCEQKNVVRLRPLGLGRYPFMGEFHADTAQGVVIAE